MITKIPYSTWKFPATATAHLATRSGTLHMRGVSVRFLEKAGSHREKAKCASWQYGNAEAPSGSFSAAVVGHEVRRILGP